MLVYLALIFEGAIAIFTLIKEAVCKNDFGNPA